MRNADRLKRRRTSSSQMQSIRALERRLALIREMEQDLEKTRSIAAHSISLAVALREISSVHRPK
jgi:hypothetical protein